MRMCVVGGSGLDVLDSQNTSSSFEESTSPWASANRNNNCLSCTEDGCGATMARIKQLTTEEVGQSQCNMPHPLMMV
jgi:hypothetical protein